MLFALLICTVPGREGKLERLLGRIEPYRNQCHVHIEDGSDYPTIGDCRWVALMKQESEYVSFVDDDDLLTEDAIPTIIDALDERPDCVAIREVRYENGIFRGISYHYLDCVRPGKTRINDVEWRFDRYINHVCPTRTEIAKAIGFKSMNRGEDQDYSERLRKSGLLKTCAVIERPIYEYWYRTEALRDPENRFEMKALGLAD